MSLDSVSPPSRCCPSMLKYIYLKPFTPFFVPNNIRLPFPAGRICQKADNEATSFSIYNNGGLPILFNGRRAFGLNLIIWQYIILYRMKSVSEAAFPFLSSLNIMLIACSMWANVGWKHNSHTNIPIYTYTSVNTMGWLLQLVQLVTLSPPPQFASHLQSLCFCHMYSADLINNMLVLSLFFCNKTHLFPFMFSDEDSFPVPPQTGSCQVQ